VQRDARRAAGQASRARGGRDARARRRLTMYLRFAFEGDVHETLATIPLAVRRKLDLAGLKLSLAGWTALSRAERLAVCHLPVESRADLEIYREALRGFAERAGHPVVPLEG